MMLACIDVSYHDTTAVAGCLLFRDWADRECASQIVTTTTLDAPYKPGEFYLRELPPILALLKKLDVLPSTIVVDGYVWLGGENPGLGARLHSALSGAIPIVGVAKTGWGGPSIPNPPPDDPRRTVPVVRGSSSRPLFVTSVGVDVGAAAERIRQMHGEYRMPTLLKAVDRLVRAHPPSTEPRTD